MAVIGKVNLIKISCWSKHKDIENIVFKSKDRRAQRGDGEVYNIVQRLMLESRTSSIRLMLETIYGSIPQFLDCLRPNHTHAF